MPERTIIVINETALHGCTADGLYLGMLLWSSLPCNSQIVRNNDAVLYFDAFFLLRFLKLATQYCLISCCTILSHTNLTMVSLRACTVVYFLLYVVKNVQTIICSPLTHCKKSDSVCNVCTQNEPRTAFLCPPDFWDCIKHNFGKLLSSQRALFEKPLSRSIFHTHDTLNKSSF